MRCLGLRACFARSSVMKSGEDCVTTTNVDGKELFTSTKCAALVMALMHTGICTAHASRLTK
jgi:hypothetical protein